MKETRWTRLRAFLRGLLFYNTVYWKRASDEVDRRASRVGRAEREKLRPRVDPELLRPRARAKAEPRAPDSDVAPGDAPSRSAPARSETNPPPRLASPATGDSLFAPHLPDAASDAEQGTSYSRRRRRVMRRRELHDKAVDPGRALRARLDAKPKRDMPPWLRWLLGWRH